jgi:hypothetical protein
LRAFQSSRSWFAFFALRSCWTGQALLALHTLNALRPSRPGRSLLDDLNDRCRGDLLDDDNAAGFFNDHKISHG